MVGEIGGSAEEEAAELHQGPCHQAGGRLHRRRHRAPGKRMGHAGAIIAGGKGTAAEKIAAL
jgi:succinyl-CoA synthetase alpha subunit